MASATPDSGSAGKAFKNLDSETAQLRDLWSIPDHVSIQMMREQRCPIGYKTVRLERHQQAVAQCSADTGVAYFLKGTGGRMACLNTDVCPTYMPADDDAEEQARIDDAERRDNIHMINVYLPRLNAAVLWARRNWIVQHLVVPLTSVAAIKMAMDLDADASTDKDVKAAFPYRVNAAGFWVRETGTRKKDTQHNIAVVTPNGYIDWDRLWEMDTGTQGGRHLHWVTMFTRKPRQPGEAHGDARLSMQARAMFRRIVNCVLDNPFVWGALGAGSAADYGIMGRVLDVHPNFVNVEHELQDVTNAGTTNVTASAVRSHVLFGSNDPADNHMPSAQSLVDTRLDIQKDSTSGVRRLPAMKAGLDLSAHNEKDFPVDLIEIDDGQGATYEKDATMQKAIQEAMFLRVFKALRALREEFQKVYVTADADKSTHPLRECLITPAWRIDARDVDMRIAVATGIDMLPVDSPLDEKRFTVLPTRLFAWDERLESIAAVVQKEVARRGARVYVERLADILHLNGDLREQLKSGTVQEGGFRGALDPLSFHNHEELAQSAVDIILQCTAHQQRHPEMSEGDFKKDTTKLKIENFEKPVEVRELCEPMTTSDGNIRLVPRYQAVYGLEGRQAPDGTRLPARFETDPYSPEAKLFHDTAVHHKVSVDKHRKNVEYVLGVNSDRK